MIWLFVWLALWSVMCWAFFAGVMKISKLVGDLFR